MGVPGEPPASQHRCTGGAARPLPWQQAAAWGRRLLGARGSVRLWALDVRHDVGRSFFADAARATRFAEANRAAILERAAAVVQDLTGGAVESGTEIDISHNFVSGAVINGELRLLHRKGAAPAEKDQLGLIPGSMGTASYVARGLGCERSFCSSSHGAGRALPRGEARRSIRQAQFERSMAHVTFDRSRRSRPARADAAGLRGPSLARALDAATFKRRSLAPAVPPL